MTLSVFDAIEQSAVAQSVAHANHLVGAFLQIVHVVGLVLLLASVALLALRALGLGLRRYDGAPIVRETSRLLWIGLGLVATSGLLIFSSSAVRYVGNAAFDYKAVLLLAAIAAQVAADRGLASVPAGEAAPLGRRALVLGAALLWIATAGAGRAIGYI